MPILAVTEILQFNGRNKYIMVYTIKKIAGMTDILELSCIIFFSLSIEQIQSTAVITINFYTFGLELYLLTISQQAIYKVLLLGM